MANEPDENETEFLSYLEKVGLKWTGLETLLEKKISEALEKAKGPPNSPSDAPSGSYLEQQNRELLKMLLHERGKSPENQLTRGMHGVTNDEPPQPPGDKPKAPPAKTTPFWR
jgi:hypothetical protein